MLDSTLRPNAHRIAGGALFAALVMASGAAAAAPCEVRVTGDMEEHWQRAVHDLRAQLAQQPAGDCASIVLTVVDGGGHLVYTTRDGRTAERKLAGSAELLPTVEALLVTGSTATPESTQPAAPPPLHTTQPPRAAPVVVVPSTPARPVVPTPIVGIGVGARAGDHKLATPLMELSATLSLTDWELAVLGHWESGYHVLDDHPEGRRSSGLSAGVAIGRRDALGSGISLVWGADVMLASLDDESSERVQLGQGHVGHAEARLGGYVGAVVPRDTSPRFRATLGADVLPTQLGQPEKDPAGQPLTPWLAATLVLGMEIGGK